MPNTGADVNQLALDVRKQTRMSAILYAVNAILILTMGFVLYTQHQREKQDLRQRVVAAQDYREQSCRRVENLKVILRGEQVRRLADTKKYLAEHPEPKILGVDRKVFEDGMKKTQAQIDKLAPVDCVKDAKIPTPR